jgi:hypothetical protein
MIVDSKQEDFLLYNPFPSMLLSLEALLAER